MNSKEALKTFWTTTNVYDIDLWLDGDISYEEKEIKRKENEKNYNQIKKDLEILEVLKPIIKASIVMSDHGIKYGQLTLNIKTNKLLKEWLENDN